MSKDALSGSARVSFKAADELAKMLDAVAVYERRPLSAICRIALDDYFQAQGYYTEDGINRLAAGQRKGNA